MPNQQQEAQEQSKMEYKAGGIRKRKGNDYQDCSLKLKIYSSGAAYTLRSLFGWH
jgi:hypothetical protein